MKVLRSQRPERETAGWSAVLRQAVAHHRAGDRATAKRLYEKVLTVRPSQPDALNLSGVLALEHGRFEHAIRLISKAVAADPANADAHSNLGNALRAAGRSAEALGSYERALALKPDFAAAHCNLGVLRLDAGELPKAMECFRMCLALDASLVEASLGLATAHRARGELAAAEAILQGVIKRRPELSEPKAALASVLADRGDFEASFELHASAIALKPGLRRYRVQFARDLARGGRFDEAARTYRHALDLDLQDAACWNELGRVLRSLGDLAEARKCFLRAIGLKPSLMDAHRNLALFAEREGIAERVDHLRSTVHSGAAKEDIALASFALGKILDDERRFDEAFESYDLANRLTSDIHRVTGRSFDIAALRQFVNSKISEPAASPGSFTSSSELPVFIVGMPRSGTSLVEQIAASHSMVHGAGELRALGSLGTALSIKDEAAIERAVHAHLSHLRRLGGSATRVIDKMPDNVFHLDVIAALFPNARVIICERERRDVGLSCYFQLFSSGNEFSYNLETCGRRQVQTARIAEHWRANSRLRILEVSYEKLVADLERESRRLIDFLGVGWEQGCLQFHGTRRVVATASGWQVRQPLYNRSVGRWRNYEAWIEPLTKAIADEMSTHTSEPAKVRPAVQS